MIKWFKAIPGSKGEMMAKDEINAFMGMGTSYHGKLEFKGTVRIDGEFQGEIVSDGTLIIGNEARVKGEINVGQLLLSGWLDGQLKVQTKAVLYKHASLNGRILTPALVVEEGATLQCEVVMNREEAAER